MITNPEELIKDFAEQASLILNQTLPATLITHACHHAPHTPPQLPNGSGAVYVFSLPANSNAPAGINRTLKVGKANARSKQRFQTQHYGDNAPSTLAKAIQNNRILWTYVGYPPHTPITGDWMKQSLDRDSFFVSPCPDQKRIVGLLEVYIKARLGSVYEGSLNE